MSNRPIAGMTTIDIKPMTVNRAWRGRRFKTVEYRKYETDLLYLLPTFRLDKPPYKVELIFGLSNSLADIDNPIKPFLDILQKKYRFNDKHIEELHVFKTPQDKGKECISFKITSI